MSSDENRDQHSANHGHPIQLPSTIADYLNSLIEFKSIDRIESLYSDYSPSRQSNPAGFQSNNAAWKIILTDLLKLGLQSIDPLPSDDHPRIDQRLPSPHRLVLHLDDQLLDSLRWKDVGKPYGLACAIWNLSSLSNQSSSPILAPLKTFISTTGWGPSIGLTSTMLRSISWASRFLTRGSLLDPDQRFDQLDLDQKLNLVKIDWVNLFLLRQAADRVIERYQQTSVGLSPSIDCLFTRAQFQDQLTRDIFSSVHSNSNLSTPDLAVLLKHLERDRKILVADRDIIKFILPGSIETDRDGQKYSRTGPAPINEIDRGVLSVRQTIQQLNQQIQTIGTQIEQRTQEAKKYVQNSQPEIASTHLKSRKLLKQVLSQRIGILETLNGVYLKIEQASTDIEIMSAYETSTNTLKTLLATPSLKIERVEETMENLQQVLADQKDIDDAIEVGSKTTDAIDDLEIQAELATLVESDRPTEIEPTRPTMTIEELQSHLDQLKVPHESPPPVPSASSTTTINEQRPQGTEESQLLTA